MTPDKLIECIGCNSTNGEKWALHISNAMSCFDIDSPLRQAAFLAQIGHESGLLSVVEENLRYGSVGLLKTFPKYFTSELAEEYAKNPERIANRVYGNRMGNGDEASGDGWRFHGRGPIQITGKDNYILMREALGLDVVFHPEILIDPSHGAMSSGAFWSSRKLNDLADKGQFETITRKVNGGLNGQEDRLRLYIVAKKALGV